MATSTGTRNELGLGSFGAWVDMARWMAAASVLVTHVGLRMLAPVADVPHPSLAQVSYAFAAGFDHQAVMVFFVLSGLLVGGSVLRELDGTGGIAFGPYLLRRLVRLWVVLLPALGLAAACTAGALALGGGERGTVPPGAELSLPVLLCNAAFLQTAACPQFAANGALWSLFNEWWYYVLFPPLALALLSRRPAAHRAAWGGSAALALAGLTAAQFTGSALGPYMLVWAVGAAAAALPRALVRRPLVAAALFLLPSLAVRLLVRRAFAGDHPLLSAELDLLLALLFGNLLLTLRCCPTLRAPPWARLHGRLAGFSFSLYCTHIPVLVLAITATEWLGGVARPGADGAAPWPAVAGCTALCVAAAWAFSRVTEVHTGRVRAALVRAWRVPAAAAG